MLSLLGFLHNLCLHEQNSQHGKYFSLHGQTFALAQVLQEHGSGKHIWAAQPTCDMSDIVNVIIRLFFVNGLVIYTLY